jgi:uncharacterized membrane protein
VVGGVAAPILAASGLLSAAEALYSAYALTCHQWAFRSFFIFGQQAVYAQDHLEALGLDAYRVVGQPGLGWKMAFCERDLAIYVALLVAAVWYARHRNVLGLSLTWFALLSLPMAIDVLTQMYGGRESTWELRLATGVLFGIASAWLLYPRVDAFLKVEPLVRACAPQPPTG